MRKQAVDLAALDRDDDLVEARIAGYSLDRPVFILGEHARDDSIFGARIERADHKLLLRGLEFRDRRNASAPRDPKRIGRTAGATDVGKLRDVVIDALLRHHIAQEESATPRHAEREGVRRRDIVEMIGKDDPARALHIARHDDGITRNIFGEVAREHTHFAVDAAAWRKTRNNRERLAGVEILPAAGAARRQQGYNTQRNDAGPHILPIIRNERIS